MKTASQTPANKPNLEALERQANDAIRKITLAILDAQATEENRGSAAWALHRLACLAVNNLESLARQNPESLRQIAQSSMAWPAFISPHRDFVGRNKSLIQHLGIGRRSLLKVTTNEYQKKQWSFSTPATNIAQNLILETEYLRNYYRSKQRDEVDANLSGISARLGIPTWKSSPTDVLAQEFLALNDFSKQTAAHWFAVGWKLLMIKTNNRPEDFFDMARMGEHRRNHSENTGAQKRVTKATGNTNVRDAFRDRLKKVFSMLGRDSEV